MLSSRFRTKISETSVQYFTTKSQTVRFTMSYQNLRDFFTISHQNLRKFSSRFCTRISGCLLHDFVQNLRIVSSRLRIKISGYSVYNLARKMCFELCSRIYFLPHCNKLRRHQKKILVETKFSVPDLTPIYIKIKN